MRYMYEQGWFMSTVLHKGWHSTAQGRTAQQRHRPVSASVSCLRHSFLHLLCKWTPVCRYLPGDTAIMEVLVMWVRYERVLIMPDTEITWWQSLRISRGYNYRTFLKVVSKLNECWLEISFYVEIYSSET